MNPPVSATLEAPDTTVDIDSLLELANELEEADPINRPAVLCNIVAIG